MSWQLQEAKARFSEVVEASLKEGPQVITRRGQETAVLVSAEEGKRVRGQAQRGLKELLLEKEGRGEFEVPERGEWRHRGE